MASKATIYKVELQVANTDIGYYQTYNHTIACHPSETHQRMMLRLLAFALNASDNLTFTKGISTDTEPDLWWISDSGEIKLWIELGTPDEKRIKKACNKAQQVILYTYGGNTVDTWWSQHEKKLSRHKNLKVVNIIKEESGPLELFVGRSMQIQFTIQDENILVSDSNNSLTIVPQVLLES